MRILHIDTSINFGGSVSRQVSSEILSAFTREFPGAQVVRRDLGRDPLCHVSFECIQALRGAQVSLTPEQEAQSAIDREALKEFIEADVIIMGVPMYNLTVPSALKAWFDRICITGVTFQYTETGPVGIYGDKLVLISSARGGVYTGESPFCGWEHQESYLRSVFSLIGIESLYFIQAEGLDMGDQIRDPAVSAAIGQAKSACCWAQEHLSRQKALSTTT